MAEPTMREVLAQLESLQIEMATLKLRQHRARAPRRLLPALLIAFLVALGPLSLLAATPFTDLTGGVHDANIDAIYNAGVTTGCVPPPDPNPQYCPTANVTREAMASFLARLGGLGSNPPVANAKTLQGYAPSGLVRTNVSGTGDTVTTLTSDYQSLTTVSLETPGPGFVIVVGAVNLEVGDSNPSDALVSARVRDVPTDQVSFALAARIGTFTGGSLEAALTPTTVFSVPAAGLRTFSLDVGRGPSSSGVTVAKHGTITALFVPFGAGGLHGAEVPGTTRPAGPPESPARPERQP